MKKDETRVCDGQQDTMQDVRRACDIRQTVSAERRNKFATLANIYTDGIMAGMMLASGKVQ